MEKLVYVLWTRDGETDETLGRNLVGPVREKLVRAGVERLQVNVSDTAVAAGEGLRQRNIRPAPSALVSFWLNSAHIRAPYENALREVCGRLAGYAVSESTVLPNKETFPDGTRVHGFAQIALIARPPRLTQDAYLDVWLKSHTHVGVETQSNFYYCQNIVCRPLTYDAPPLASIVEERFPIGALADQELFYDAAGNPEKYEKNLKRMMDSCSRFVDFDRIDVMVTSAYRFGGWADASGQPDFPR